MLAPTPLYRWEGLSSLVDADLLLKHENHQPIGAFKVRGGINLLSTLEPEHRQQGILGVTTGNHGQSLAFAARHFGVACTIVVPEGNNPEKNQRIRELGAELIEQGFDYNSAVEYSERLIAQRHCRYVHSANEPALVAGVGTMAWEVFETLPDPDVILVPIGLGSGACGTCLVAKHRRPQTRVIGVQATGASAVAESWRTGEIVSHDRVDTWAEGLATRVPASLTLDILRELMDDVVLVSDDELRVATYRIMKHAHQLVEGAGAAAFAAACQIADQLHGKKVVAIVSGGNLDLAQLPEIIACGRAAEAEQVTA